MINVIHYLEENYCYPCLPKEMGNDPIESYLQRLKIGFVFAYNDDSSKLIILKFARINNNEEIFTMCEREGNMCEMEGFHPWSIFEIRPASDSLIHTRLGSYFEKDDADNAWNNFINQNDADL